MINQAQVGTEWWKDIVKKYSPPTPSITCRGPKTRHQHKRIKGQWLVFLKRWKNAWLCLYILVRLKLEAMKYKINQLNLWHSFACLWGLALHLPKKPSKLTTGWKSCCISVYTVRIFNIYILVLYQLLAKIYFFFFVFLYFLIFFYKTWHTLYGELLVNPTFRLYHLSSFYDSLYQLSASWYWHSKIPVHVDSANCNLNYAPCGVRLKVVGAAMIHKQNS